MACTNAPNFDDSGDVQGDVISTEVDFFVEEAFPDIEKEIYITASGIVLEKLDSLYILNRDLVLSKEQVLCLDGLQTRGAIMTEVNRQGLL